MFENLGIFSMAQAMATHSAARQAVIAGNVANADTPGYRARDLASFGETFRANATGALHATRPGHDLTRPDEPARQAQAVHRPNAAAPNGNTVSLEQEMFAAAEAKGEHDRALAIYRSAMTILRSSVGGRG
ncbi:FlgB family protein [Sinisalibacter aestuarii]|uniref:Flagellar biosynthesis protein FlgB n=1 Tax=Sinisalibacter aestuarii TaxID=2949426 RepID=A0ABQ5LP02_9RHOB|nr:FlgB family protein [Sinisalibacter aestuarii]GKY86693.1 flagellar biosynthesis protein FlgB [Sinisalibacter aestuarii]